MKKCIIIFYLINSVLFSFGQATTNAKPDSLNSALINELRSRELDTYKKLVETAENANEDLRETNHWFIGLTITFIAVVLGSQIFYNVQLNNKKLEAIREGLAKELEEYKTKVSNDLGVKVEDVGKKIEEKGKEQREQMDKRFDLMTRAQDIENKLLEQGYERETKSLGARLDKLDAEVWVLKGVESNALTGYVNSALKEAELNRDLKYSLEDIIRVLNNVEDLFQTDANKIEELIKVTQEKYKGKYLAELDTIKKLFSQKGIFTLETNTPFYPGLAGGLLGAYRRSLKKRGKVDE